jgi:hypothetical protein
MNDWWGSRYDELVCISSKFDARVAEALVASLGFQCKYENS